MSSVGFVGLLFLWLNCIALQNTVTAAAPNIVFILADDYGWHDIGYHDSKIRTPNLDKLAKDGVRLENYYVQPICTPTRSQLLSGRYQIHTGLQHAIILNSQPNGLPLDDPTIADKLRQAGYATHMVGKWHLGFYKKEYMPTYRGFDSHFGYLSGAEDYYTKRTGKRLEEEEHHVPKDGYDLRDNMEVAWNQTEYSTTLYTRKAQNVIKNHNPKKPLFLYFPLQSVHMPLEVPDSYVKPYDFIKDASRRTYAGMVSCMDEAVGNITRSLMEYGLYNNTVIIFSTDNGGLVYGGANNWPLRGGKGTLWEGGVRGVGFVHSALLTQKQQTRNQLMHVSDWFPTLLRLAGVHSKIPKLDGFDIWDAISSNAPSRRRELLHNIDPLMVNTKGVAPYPHIFDSRVRAAIRVGEWKLITGKPGNGSWVPPPEERSEGHSQQDSSSKTIWLFNIKDDPNERKDLSDKKEKIELVKSMLEKLAAYNRTAVPVRFPDDDPRSDPALHGGAWGPWED